MRKHPSLGGGSSQVIPSCAVPLETRAGTGTMQICQFSTFIDLFAICGNATGKPLVARVYCKSLVFCWEVWGERIRSHSPCQNNYLKLIMKPENVLRHSRCFDDYIWKVEINPITSRNWKMNPLLDFASHTTQRWFPTCTPPKFHSSPLKNDAWKIDPFLFGFRLIFRGKRTVKLPGGYCTINPPISLPQTLVGKNLLFAGGILAKDVDQLIWDFSQKEDDFMGPGVSCGFGSVAPLCYPL